MVIWFNSQCCAFYRVLQNMFKQWAKTILLDWLASFSHCCLTTGKFLTKNDLLVNELGLKIAHINCQDSVTQKEQFSILIKFRQSYKDHMIWYRWLLIHFWLTFDYSQIDYFFFFKNKVFNNLMQRTVLSNWLVVDNNCILLPTL